MNIQVHGMTDCGLQRSANEDALFIDESRRTFAVADGVGGLPGGAAASGRIVELLAKTFNHLDSDQERVDLSELVTQINRIVTQEGLLAHPTTGSGSTLSIGQLLGDQLLIAHVGDSAIYRLRDMRLEQLTIDHTMEQEFIDEYGQEARLAMPPEYPHTLTRCVGQRDELRIDQTRVTLKSEDRVLFCTDGLNKVLTNLQIQCLLEASNCPEIIAQSLVESANANEGPDNITIIVLIIE